MIKKIMIVDDALFTRNMIRNILIKHGEYEIIEAVDGQAALERFKQERADLILLDITMPKKNGLETLQELMAFDDQANVIMCSALGQENLILEAIRNGAKDFIVKPFKETDIIRVVEEYCDDN